MPPEGTTLYFVDLENDELFHLNYKYIEPFDYGRLIGVIFSLRDSNNELVYENLIEVDLTRKEKDLEPALRFFLHLHKNRKPIAKGRGEIVLSSELRDEYQSPDDVDFDVLTVKVLEALELFESYHPVEGLSNLELMISIDVNQQSLLRAINRLTARGIVKSTTLEGGYAIADHDKADDYKVKLMGELPDPSQQLLERQRRIGFARNNLK